MGDEPHLVERARHGRDLVDRGQVHVAITRVARIDVAVRAGARAHDEAAVRARQGHVEVAPLGREPYRFRGRRQGLGDHPARQAQPVRIAPLLRAGHKEGLSRLGVQDDHAVVGKDVDDARLQRLDLTLVKKAESDPGADLPFLPERIRRDREPGNTLAPVHPGGFSVLHPYLLAER